MGMGGGSQSSKTTSEPWKVQQPYLEQGFKEAQDLYNEGPAEYFPGNTYTDLSPQTQQGLLGIEQTATNGNPIINNAAGYTSNVLGGNSDNPYAPLLGMGAGQLGATAGGAYLGNNPTLDATFNQAAGRLTDTFQNSVAPTIAAQFGLSGGTGSALHGLALSDAGGQLGDSLADLGANIYGNAYENERNRQTGAASNLASLGTGLYGTGVNERLQALGLSPTIREAQFGDSQKMLDAGKIYEEQSNKELQDAINRFNYGQNADLASLQDYLALISGNYGGTSVTRGSSSGSGLNTALGGVATLASLFG